MTTDWVRSQFGGAAAEVTRRVAQAMAAAHRSGLEAQAASGMTKKFPFGSVWPARFDNLVAELYDMPDVEIIPVVGAPYQLVKLQGKVLIPFRLGTTLAVRPSDARIESQVLRDLAALSVPRPVPPPNLFDDEVEPDIEPGAVPQQRSAVDRPAVIDGDTPIIYIGVVANADSKAVLAAWWGTGEAQDEDGRLTWSPEPLPLDVLVVDATLAPVPEPRSADRIPAFDQGEVPPMTVLPRSRPMTAPLPGDDAPLDPAASDDRE